MGMHAYLCFSVCMCICECTVPRGQKRVLSLLELGVAGCFESPEVYAEDKLGCTCEQQAAFSSLLLSPTTDLYPGLLIHNSR